MDPKDPRRSTIRILPAASSLPNKSTESTGRGRGRASQGRLARACAALRSAARRCRGCCTLLVASDAPPAFPQLPNPPPPRVRRQSGVEAQWRRGRRAGRHRARGGRAARGRGRRPRGTPASRRMAGRKCFRAWTPSPPTSRSRGSAGRR
eukprot:scaffold3595_cov235-Ochromonas_danica.AAC.30